MPRRRIIVNNDFYNIFQVAPPVTDQDVLDAVDRMVEPAIPGSQVDTLFLLIDEGLEGDVVGADLRRMYDHPDADPSIESLQRFREAGKDPWRMIVERAHAKGLEIFASVRMNDTHYKDQPFNPWLPRFYYDHLQDRLDPLAGYARGPMESRRDTEFDYRRSAVRERYLHLVRSNAQRYDVDGVELDFTRNCRFFPTGNPEECAPILVEFVRSVRSALDEIGQRRARRPLLAATIPYSLHGARLEGVDVVAMARLGLLDLVCMSTPFYADLGRDIADTVAKLPGVPVYGGCDRNLRWPGRPVPKEAYRAMAASYLRQGAAGTYLYNVMHWTIRLDDMPEMLKVVGGQSNAVHDACLMSELGELATLEGRDKLYVVGQGAEYPGTADKPFASLPAKVDAGGEVTLRVYVGDDVQKDGDRIERILVQAISPDCGDYNNYTLKLNGIDLARQYAFNPYATQPPDRFIFPEPENTTPPVPVAHVRRHAARLIDLHPGINLVTIKSWKEAMAVSDVEIGIVYRR